MVSSAAIEPRSTVHLTLSSVMRWPVRVVRRSSHEKQRYVANPSPPPILLREANRGLPAAVSRPHATHGSLAALIGFVTA